MLEGFAAEWHLPKNVATAAAQSSINDCFNVDIDVDYFVAHLDLLPAVRVRNSAICNAANILNGDWRQERVTRYCMGCCPPGREADRVVRACLDLIAPNKATLQGGGGGPGHACTGRLGCERFPGNGC